MRPLSDTTKARIRNHAFRIWTAGAILAAYIYAWFDVPELLTWWKHASEAAIEAACGLLPYPWNDRIEATLGNFGLWVQITLAIIAFRILVWFAMLVLGTLFVRRQRETPPPSRH